MQLIIYNNQNKITYSPVCLDDIELSYERFGVAGKLSFKVLKGSMESGEQLDFHEGDYVFFSQDNKNIFKGVIVSKSRDKQEGAINVTALDQLFYLVKCKHFCCYENKTLTDIVRLIAQEFKLEVGDLDNSSYSIPQRIEENKSLMDIIGYAIDTTLINRGDLFVLYDDYGKLTLKNVNNMAVPYDKYYVTSSNALGFDYQTSIENDTYNRVVIYRENKETKAKDFYPVQDVENINKWGILQTTEKADDSENPTIKGQQILACKNRVKKSLTIKNAVGNIDIRCGSSILVWLYVGDEVLKTYFMVEKLTHHFKHEDYTMDLTLVNRDFSV